MSSELRHQIIKTMEAYREILQPDNRGWKIIEVGIDGDERPSGNYRNFGQGNDFKTLDFLPRLQPDIVADITDTKLPTGEWDLIILSQTLEHILDYDKALRECYRLLKTGGYLIVDTPFSYVYHGIPEYDDYWRLTHVGLRRVLTKVGFKVITCNIYEELLTSALAQKYD